MKFAYKVVFIWIQTLLVLYTNLNWKIEKECFLFQGLLFSLKRNQKKSNYETTAKNKDKIIFQIYI